MRSYQKISAWLTGGVALSAIVVALFFQNCGKAGFDADESAVTMAANLASAKNADAPFAFDSAFDEISYMSCAGNNSNKDAFYSIKAGGYDNSGLKLSDTFLSYSRAKVPAIYPAAKPSIEQLKVYLSEAAASVGAAPQLSLRLRNDLRSVYSSTGSSPAFGVDYFNILLDPTDDRIMDPLFRQTGFVNYFALAPVGSRNFESKLNFSSTPGAALNFRTLAKTSGVLALTYQDTVSTSNPRGLQANYARAYGRGYILNFTASSSSVTASENWMNAITEMDLTTSNVNTSSVWTCSAADRFMIYRFEDRAACVLDAARTTNTAADQNYRVRLGKIQRHLKPEYWNVSLDRNCAFPKDASLNCYPTNYGSVGIEYATIGSCNDGSTAVSVKYCAAYASFCFKN